MNHLVYLALVFLSLYSLCLSLPHEQTYTLIVGGLSLSLCVFLSILYNVCDLLLSPLYGETNKAPSCINKLRLWLCGVSHAPPVQLVYIHQPLKCSSSHSFNRTSCDI